MSSAQTSRFNSLCLSHYDMSFSPMIYLQESRDTLQSQYVALNKKHEELAKEFSKLQEYYCDGTNTSHGELNTCPLCKLGWIPFSSKCYFISTKTKTWNESHDWCLTKGGQLVNIENSEEWVSLRVTICALCLHAFLVFDWISGRYVMDNRVIGDALDK
uniref:C-type lectin domain-containing protein n=1 Tax=Erpetoichthys calabaricus TaxID=27687 RepID=A0A8C4SYQ9_ERPCA